MLGFGHIDLNIVLSLPSFSCLSSILSSSLGVCAHSLIISPYRGRILPLHGPRHVSTNAISSTRGKLEQDINTGQIKQA